METTTAGTEAEAGTEAAGGTEPSIAGTTIEIAYGGSGAFPEDSFAELVDKFEEQTGATVVETNYPREDYEAIMKIRMASGEMPDVLETHGWSRLRYGEYLYPVNDEPWYEDETELAKGILTGDGDTAYAQMVSSTVLGIMANKTAADAAGVDIYAIETMDDFKEACQVLVDQGIVPISSGSSEAIAYLTHWAGIYTSYPDALSCDAEAQLDGTWDWESYRPLLEDISELINMGAFWEDCMTVDVSTVYERLAEGRSVFAIGTTATVGGAMQFNPDNEYVIVPFPAIKEGAKRYIAGGESVAFGIYKDTKEFETCRQFLQFLADNCGMLKDISGVPALKNVEFEETPQTDAALRTMEEYPDAVYTNMWDREYMPSGMWGVFGEAAGMVFNDNSPENLEQTLEFLRENYVEKYEAAHSGE